MLAVAMIAIGVAHFRSSRIFVQMVPPALPAPLLLVYLSGGAEIAGGLGLLLVRFRRAASLGLIALYVAVFPANVYMAWANLPLGNLHLPSWVLWARLPFQALFIVWAYWVGKSN